MTLYDRIGGAYDETRRADPYLASRLLAHLGDRRGQRCLDLSCGTGNYTAILAAAGAAWTGVDVSEGMLRAAGVKRADVSWVRADVTALPFSEGVFSGATCVLAIHHYPSIPDAFTEVARVLAPGAPLVIFTSTAEEMEGYWLNAYFPRAMRRSIEQMPSRAAIDAALRAANLELIGEEPYLVQPDLQDAFLYAGKHDPRRYLSERMRRGISTFASLADPAEVAEGTARLADDLSTGRISEVIARFADSGAGDYLFLVARHHRGSSGRTGGS